MLMLYIPVLSQNSDSTLFGKATETADILPAETSSKRVLVLSFNLLVSPENYKPMK